VVNDFASRGAWLSEAEILQCTLVLQNSKQPRIDPVEPPYQPEVATALAALGPPIALFRLFARKPERAHAIHAWGRYYLSRHLSLSLRDRELVIDRTTARCGADYEWSIHLSVYAAKAGLTDAQIASLQTGYGRDPCWDTHDRAVIDAVDALHDHNDLDDAHWDRLVDAVGPDGAIDLLLVCGWYHAISYVARCTRLAPEP